MVTSENRTTSLQGTKGPSTTCPLFRGFTVILVTVVMRGNSTVVMLVTVVIGASLSEPHTSRTALQDACVCLSAYVRQNLN